MLFQMMLCSLILLYSITSKSLFSFHYRHAFFGARQIFFRVALLFSTLHFDYNSCPCLAPWCKNRGCAKYLHTPINLFLNHEICIGEFNYVFLFIYFKAIRQLSSFNFNHQHITIVSPDKQLL